MRAGRGTFQLDVLESTGRSNKNPHLRRAVSAVLALWCTFPDSGSTKFKEGVVALEDLRNLTY